MKKSIDQMTEKELLETWTKACYWTIQRMQVTGTNKNKLGELYNHELCMMAIGRIEKLEDEMNRKGVNYGRGD